MSYPNRTMCDVIEELRKCFETRNFSSALGLAEEIQSMANRMEASLSDKRDVKRWTKERNELSEEMDKLNEEIGKLKKQKEKLGVNKWIG